jgi:hypothetical protein
MRLDHVSQENIEKRYTPLRILITITNADMIPELSNDQKIFFCDEGSP